LQLISKQKGRNMMAVESMSQAEFYKEFLMARHSFQPSDFGVNMDKDEFIDQMCEDFNDTFRGQTTVDEVLLHPRDALRFCDSVRMKLGYYDLPDDIILRSILQRRKNP
jgi:hypothetical protein